MSQIASTEIPSSSPKNQAELLHIKDEVCAPYTGYVIELVVFQYKEYKCIIMHQTYPKVPVIESYLAYILLPKEHPYVECRIQDLNELELQCFGEFTWSGPGLPGFCSKLKTEALCAQISDVCKDEVWSIGYDVTQARGEHQWKTINLVSVRQQTEELVDQIITQQTKTT